MPFAPELYDAETLQLMTRALKAAMDECADAAPDAEFYVIMANRITSAAAAGVCDLDTLKREALSALSSAA
jgi:hypothetical protein